MPVYQVKEKSTIENEGKLYQSGAIVELPSSLGAFHEPNVMVVATEAAMGALDEDDDEDDDDEDDDEDDDDD
jgi:hypothetical protein